MNDGLAEGYKSNSQKARVITENWVDNNMFCPICGNINISRLENNKPVADFYCQKCNQQYELKSKNTKNISKIVDGAYATMIDRITSHNNPHLFCMSYSTHDWCVRDFLLIPKYFFTPVVIEKRPPLADTARRRGWVGCNILLTSIPAIGKISIIENGNIKNKKDIMHKVALSEKLQTKDINDRCWLLDVFACIEKIKSVTFCLKEVYAFENTLSMTHPNNHHIKDKIRQQLQVLRNKGFIEFLGDGKYRKVT